MRNNSKYIWAQLILGLSFGCISTVYAAPIVVDGVVADEATKQTILLKMQSVYGKDQVVDKIEVRPVATPLGWSEAATAAITSELKKVKQGQLHIQGTQIELTGKVTNPQEIASTTKVLQTLVQQPYQFNAQLSVNQAEQKVIDDALKNRIIEFESGSAILTVAGKKILDEMAVALNQVGTKKVKIIGHTDSSGDAEKNLVLSQQRAAAVQSYLVAKHIAADRLSAEGKGANQPIADNTTAEGRRKNRRIEFEVL